MAVPKRKTSKQRKHTRSANWKITAVNLEECPQCHEQKKSHRACPKCGFYNGRQIIEKKD
ncbi:MAG TPA: 50S ribosomal protein L32 [Eubacteriales bacterium]|jgi:large subunit ribosomal protein L32|nr:50S ribosomal protein L32 [Eubacteriales bacterium]HRU84267.1 50S ribosomal protein L32 [Eubacteriales bacterium]